jgi:F-type H+-transporting ATPase subunit a
MEHLYPIIGKGTAFEINLTVIGMSILACLIVLLLARLAVANIDVRRPRGMQNFFEWLIDFISGLAKDTIGDKKAMTYVPLAFALILYLFISNQMGLITNIATELHHPIPALGITEETIAEATANGGHASVAWFMSPTADLSLAMAMSIGIVTMTHLIGLRRPGSYFKHYFQPNPLMFPLHLIDEVAKFLTLGLRLYGNIFAGEVLIAILLGLGVFGSVPLVVWLAYSMFVGSIQAFVFTVLTLVYIGQKLPHDEAH